MTTCGVEANGQRSDTLRVVNHVYLYACMRGRTNGGRDELLPEAAKQMVRGRGLGVFRKG